MTRTVRDIGLYISLGNGNYLGVTDSDQLIIFNETDYRFDLGLITKDRIEALQYYLERMKIHAIDYKGE